MSFRGIRPGSVSAGSYMLPTQKLVSSMTVAPTSARTQLINKCIFDLFQAGLWQKMDVLWMLAAHDEQAGRLNWVNPATFTCSAVNSPTFTTDLGFTGNGTTSYLDTNFTPNTDGVQYLDNAGSFGVWTTTTGSRDTCDFGANKDASLLRITSTSRTQFRIQNSAPVNAAIGTNNFGFKQAVRTGSTASEMYSNGVSIGTSAQASNGRSIQSMYVLARNNAGVPTTFSDRRVVCAYMGANLSSAEVSTLYTILNTYFSAIGAV